MRRAARRDIRNAARALASVIGAVVVIGASPAMAGTGQSGIGQGGAGQSWPAYLNGPAHTSYAPSQTAITPANAPGLVQKWHFVGIGPTIPGQPADAYLA